MFDMVVRDGIWYESVERHWKSGSELGVVDDVLESRWSCVRLVFG